LVDSAYIIDAEMSLDGGVWAEVRNSQFVKISTIAISGSASPLDSTILVLRSNEFTGPQNGECSFCGYAAYLNAFSVTVDTVTASLLYAGFYLSDGNLNLQNATFNSNYYDVSTNCSGVNAQRVVSVGSDYGFNSYGCAGEPLVIATSSFTNSYSAVYASNMAVAMTDDTVTNSDYGVEVYSGTLNMVGGVVTDPVWGAVQHWGDSIASTTITGLSVACVTSGGGSVAAVNINNSNVQVVNSVLDGCYSGMTVGNFLGPWDLLAPAPVEIRGNTVTMPAASGYLGIEVSGDAALSTVTANTVSGSGMYGSIVVQGAGSAPSARIDSNTVTGSTGAGVLAEWIDSLWVRGNNIASHLTSGCCVFTGDGAVVIGGSATTNVLGEISNNRIVATQTNGIVLVRSFGDTVTLLLDSNTVRTAGASGIVINDYSIARLRYNAVDSAALDAVEINIFGPVTPIINNNNFTNSSRYGVGNYSGLVVDGTNNWWNDALGPSGFYGEGSGASVGDSVSSNVTWAPALAAAEPNAPLPLPPLFSSLNSIGRTVDPGISSSIREQVPPEPVLHARPLLQTPDATMERLPDAAEIDRVLSNLPNDRATRFRMHMENAERQAQMMAEDRAEFEAVRREVFEAVEAMRRRLHEARMEVRR
ncbi:MAG: hypothetical protein OEZ54_09185, partial [Gemmatimonadota bacterium]|nr:hypothetical protein [Gemmatimonadota bacterium]